ncbi:hypothetical protein, partial [Cupriavidus necator]|uniref:hypothetical protein n=1 Tax=Cupriavidus necator TaxID=106590 RepID=UPI0030F39F02
MRDAKKNRVSRQSDFPYSQYPPGSRKALRRKARQGSAEIVLPAAQRTEGLRIARGGPALRRH